MPRNRHNELVKILVKLGNILGFRTYSADKLERNYFNDLPKTLDRESLTFVENVDVIWFNRHNYPVYAFEVELTSGVSSGFSRLYQLRHFICNFFIVIDNESENYAKYKNKFDKLTTSDPYLEVEDRFFLIESKDLIKLLKISEGEYNLKKNILGMRVDFFEKRSKKYHQIAAATQLTEALIVWLTNSISGYNWYANSNGKLTYAPSEIKSDSLETTIF